MSLILVPYNGAMRLGQGFNSYSQQICIDDAVVVDPDRVENVVADDGATMSITTQASSNPNAWTRQKEAIVDERAAAVLHEREPAAAVELALIDDVDAGEAEPSDGQEAEAGKPADEAVVFATPDGTDESDSDSIQMIGHHETEEAKEAKSRRANTVASAQTRRRLKNKGDAEDAERAAREKEAEDRIAEQAAYPKEIEERVRGEERVRRAEDWKKQQKIREEKRNYEAQRREDNRKAIVSLADVKSLRLGDLDKIRAQDQLTDRFVGIADNQDEFTFGPNAPRRPSQTVVYRSKFVDRLSDVTDDMSVSGALSIKAAEFGGSGRGSFVDSDKFMESDLNFYISVKVINQSISPKDALIYNPLRSVEVANFRDVYGDSFVSGFLEG